MQELEETFQRISGKCPDDIRYKIIEWEHWMIHYIHEMWKDGAVSNDELAYLIDRVCTF